MAKYKRNKVKGKEKEIYHEKIYFYPIFQIPKFDLF